ncbi:hypothetical protein O9992_01145 [Vibrio lentus]|nr:hypothetical protein [Vibrio lentus]
MVLRPVLRMETTVFTLSFSSTTLGEYITFTFTKKRWITKMFEATTTSALIYLCMRQVTVTVMIRWMFC